METVTLVQGLENVSSTLTQVLHQKRKHRRCPVVRSLCLQVVLSSLWFTAEMLL